MTSYIVQYLTTAVFFLAVDAIWLGLVAKSFYFEKLSHLMMDQPNLGIAAGFYLVYAIGIVIFAVQPALSGGGWKTALIYGALFGFFCYATYDLTNLSTLRDWPVSVAIVDIIWGAVITGSAATFGFFASRWILAQMAN